MTDLKGTRKRRALKDVRRKIATRFILPKSQNASDLLLLSQSANICVENGDHTTGFARNQLWTYQDAEFGLPNAEGMDLRNDQGQCLQLCQGVDNTGIEMDVHARYDSQIERGCGALPLTTVPTISHPASPRVMRRNVVADVLNCSSVGDIPPLSMETWPCSEDESNFKIQHWIEASCVIPLMVNLQRHIGRQEEILDSYHQKILQKGFASQEMLLSEAKLLEQRLDNDRAMFRTYCQMTPIGSELVNNSCR